MKKHLEHSPYIIANKINAYVTANTYTEKFDLIEKIYTQVLRYFSCICLSEYLIDTKSNAKVNISINGLIRPSIGDWLGFLNTYISYKTKENEQLFIRELNETFKSLVKTKVDVLVDEADLSEYDSKSVIDAILIFRNKLRHGSYTPDENMFQAYVQIYEPCIAEILNAFYEIFTNYKIVRYKETDGMFGPHLFTVLCGASEDSFSEIERNEEDFEEEVDFEEEELYLLDGDNRVLPLGNLFKSYLEETDEEYIIYDGLNKANIRYVGIKRSYTIEKYIDQLRMKFLEKKIPIKFGKKLNDMDGMKDYVNDLSMVSINIHERSGKYNENTYVKRWADFQVQNFIESDKSGLIITAEAGSGKSNLMCHFSREFIKQGDMVYFINGYKLNKINSDQPIFSEFKEELISGDEFSSIGEFFEVLNKRMDDSRRFILVVDAVNESYCTMEILNELDRVICQLPYYEWLKVIITIRSEYFKRVKHYITERMGKRFLLFSDATRYYSMDGELEVHNELELKNWSILQEKEAYDKYKDKYQVQCKGFFELSPSLWKLLSVPLNMKIYFTTLVKEDASAKILKKIHLFEAYHQYLLKESGELSKATYELLFYIVDQMLSNKRSSIETEVIEQYNSMLIKREKIKDMIGVLTPYERLLDMNILQERRVDEWYETRFVYQAYLEYLIYTVIRDRYHNAEELTRLFLDSFSWIELPELHEAILLHLIEKNEDIFDMIDILLVQARSNPAQLQVVKDSLLKSIYEVLVDYQGNVEKLLNSAVACVQKFGFCEWLINLGQQLYYANMYEEAKLLLQALEMYVDSFKDTQSKYNLYSTLGLIIRNQCEVLEKSVRYFEKAILYGTEQQKVITRAELAKAYRINGDLSMAESILEELLKQEMLSKSIIPYITVIYQRQLCYRARGLYNKSLTLCKENYDRRSLTNNEEVRLNLKAEYATELEFSGAIEESVKIAQEVLNEAIEQGNMSLFIDTMNGLSRRYGMIGRYDESVQLAKEGLRLWEHSRYYRGQLVMCTHILKALKEKGESIDTAKEYLDKAIELSKIVKEELILDMYKEAIALWGL